MNHQKSQLPAISQSYQKGWHLSLANFDVFAKKSETYYQKIAPERLIPHRRTGE